MTAPGEARSQGPGMAGVRRLQLVEGWLKRSILSEIGVCKRNFRFVQSLPDYCLKPLETITWTFVLLSILLRTEQNIFLVLEKLKFFCS